MVKIGVIGAMSVETEHLCAKLQEKKVSQSAHLTFNEGIINGTHVVIVKSGIGKVNAAMCATVLIERFSVTHIINTGVAGSMQDDLHIFDIVVSTDAVQHDFNTVGFGYEIGIIPQMETSIFCADPFLIECAKKAWDQTDFTKKMVEGRIATGDIFVNSCEQKNIIRKHFNPMCVEMEGAAIAHVCSLYAIPFVIIRCMSDTAENVEEEYHEETAAHMSGVLVEKMLSLV
ncbi:MAG: 5'-methylthioadenosine/adenosylhomocysteine nucleosidase [Spirochaetales bacterium]